MKGLSNQSINNSQAHTKRKIRSQRKGVQRILGIQDFNTKLLYHLINFNIRSILKYNLVEGLASLFSLHLCTFSNVQTVTSIYFVPASMFYIFTCVLFNPFTFPINYVLLRFQFKENEPQNTEILTWPGSQFGGSGK